MSKYDGTKTFDNLQEAFAGESMARNKYTYFSKVAGKEGYHQIENIFLETANNEKEHAKLWFKELEGIGDTVANLTEAAKGEHFETSEMYPRMAKEAKEEGFNELAIMFEMVGKVEAAHEKRYRKLLERVEKQTVFTGEAPDGWKCGNCGYIHMGETAPEICPACKHPKSYFERKAYNY